MNCACNPEEGKVCMWHFDLDGYILSKALKKEVPELPTISYEED